MAALALFAQGCPLGCWVCGDSHGDGGQADGSAHAVPPSARATSAPFGIMHWWGCCERAACPFELGCPRCWDPCTWHHLCQAMHQPEGWHMSCFKALCPHLPSCVPVRWGHNRKSGSQHGGQEEASHHPWGDSGQPRQGEAGARAYNGTQECVPSVVSAWLLPRNTQWCYLSVDLETARHRLSQIQPPCWGEPHLEASLTPVCRGSNEHPIPKGQEQQQVGTGRVLIVSKPCSEPVRALCGGAGRGGTGMKSI